jgi:hypothetical protein
VVVPFKPDDSLLVISLDPTDGTMPPAPAPKISKEEYDVVYAWIKDGAQNN